MQDKAIFTNSFVYGGNSNPTGTVYMLQNLRLLILLPVNVELQVSTVKIMNVWKNPLYYLTASERIVTAYVSHADLRYSEKV